jgi:hypothetical protein
MRTGIAIGDPIMRGVKDGIPLTSLTPPYFVLIILNSNTGLHINIFTHLSEVADDN